MALRARFGVIFQDFVRYQMLVGENIGAGDETAVRGRGALARVRASWVRQTTMIDALPEGYRTQLGKWFQGGRELSGGQWQKIARGHARSCAAMRTFACWTNPPRPWMPKRRSRCSEHVRDMAEGRMTILISHRFSTVRMADEIVVLDGGRVAEAGNHDSLMQQRRRLCPAVCAAGQRLPLAAAATQAG